MCRRKYENNMLVTVIFLFTTPSISNLIALCCYFCRLCIATLKILKFRNENEAVFGMFDGGHNDEVPKLLLDSVPEILQDELLNTSTQHKYIKYAMLTAHRSVQTKLCVLYHLQCHVLMNSYMLGMLLNVEHLK